MNEATSYLAWCLLPLVWSSVWPLWPGTSGRPPGPGPGTGTGSGQQWPASSTCPAIAQQH